MNRRLAHVTIENYKAIDRLSFDVGAFVLVSGFNGEGKTAIIEAMLWCTKFRAWHDPRVIRGYSGPEGRTGAVGLGGVPEAERASVEYQFEDGATIRRECTRSQSIWTIIDETGLPVKDKEAWLAKLSPEFTFDPLSFCSAKPQERLDWYYRVAGVRFTSEMVNTVSGHQLVAPGVELSLNQLDSAYKGLYEKRAEANAGAKRAEGAWKSLAAQVSMAHSAVDWGGERARIESAIASAESQIKSGREAARQKTQVEVLEETARVTGIIAELRSRIAKLEEELKVFSLETTARNDSEADAALAALRESVTTLRLDLLDAKRNEESSIRSSEITRQADTWRAEMVTHNTNADEMTRSLQALQNLKADAIKSSPLPDIKVGEVLDKAGHVAYLDLEVNQQGAWVPWRHVNTSEQMTVAIRLGFCGSGELALMISDHGGEFDPQRLKDLAARVEAAGGQLVVAAASANPLRVGGLDKESEVGRLALFNLEPGAPATVVTREQAGEIIEAAGKCMDIPTRQKHFIKFGFERPVDCPAHMFQSVMAAIKAYDEATKVVTRRSVRK